MARAAGPGCGRRCGSGRGGWCRRRQQHLPDADARSVRRTRCSGRPAGPGRRWPRPAGGQGRVGLRSSPSGASPAAMAPLETRTISFSPPRPGRWPSTSTRASTRSASRPPAAVVREDEPTLTTILRASATSCLTTVTPANLCRPGPPARGHSTAWTGRRSARRAAVLRRLGTLQPPARRAAMGSRHRTVVPHCTASYHGRGWRRPVPEMGKAHRWLPTFTVARQGWSRFVTFVADA